MKPTPSYRVSFSAPHDALQELFAGGNRRTFGKANSDLAQDFQDNALEHACEELKILGELLCAEPEELDKARLGNRLWRIATQIEASQAIGCSLRTAKIEEVCECETMPGGRVSTRNCALHAQERAARSKESEAAE